MLLTYQDSLFVLYLSAPSQIYKAQEAGFFWDGSRWITQDPYPALTFVRRSDQLATAAFDEIARRESGESLLSVDQKLHRADDKTYFDFQQAFIQWAMNRPGILLADPMGLGKEQPNSFPVPTPSGFSLMGEIKTGDDVFDERGLPTKVIGVYPQGIKKVFRVQFSDGTFAECGDDHLWMVRDSTWRRHQGVHGGDGWRTMTTKELRSCSLVQGKKKKTFRFWIPRSEAVKHTRKSFKIDPYFVGSLIGDGCYCQKIGVTLTLCDDDKHEILDRIPPPTSSRFNSTGCETFYYPTKLLNDLKEIGLSEKSTNKSIPENYLFGSVGQRLELLRGLMDTDGSCFKNRVVYHTRSRRLAEDVKRLVDSLGGFAVVNSYQRESGTDIQVQIQIDACPFHVQRKASEWSPVSESRRRKRSIISITLVGEEESTCISVASPKSLYLTGKNYVVTHNTVQALGLINHCPDIKKILVITRVGLKRMWLKEADDWIERPMFKEILTGSEEFPTSDMVIMNYDILTKHSKELKRVAWDLVVLDEAHVLKNRKSRRCVEVVGGSIRQNGVKTYIPPIPGVRKLALTGTPFHNKPMELWPVINYIDPDNWGDFWEFAHNYCGAKSERWGWTFDGAQNLSALNLRLRRTVMVRRPKEKVAPHLKDKIRQILEVDPNSKQKDLLEKEQKAFDKATKKKKFREIQCDADWATLNEDAVSYQEAASRLEKAETVAMTEISKARISTALTKVPLIHEQIEEEMRVLGKKLIVFAHHHEVVDALAEPYQDQSVTITGREIGDKKDALVNRFKGTDRCRIIFGGIRSLGEGHNLTEASTILFAELDWVPAWMRQAEDRCHRLGQLDPVFIRYIVLRGSIDARMIQTLVDKQDVFDAAIDGKSATIESRSVLTHLLDEGTEEDLQVSDRALDISNQVLRVLDGLKIATSGKKIIDYLLSDKSRHRKHFQIGKRLAVRYQDLLTDVL